MPTYYSGGLNVGGFHPDLDDLLQSGPKAQPLRAAVLDMGLGAGQVQLSLGQSFVGSRGQDIRKPKLVFGRRGAAAER